MNPYMPTFAGLNFMGNGAFGGQVAQQLAPGYSNLLNYQPQTNQITNVKFCTSWYHIQATIHYGKPIGN